MRKLSCSLIITMFAAGAATAQPADDRRIQRAHANFEDDLSICERNYQRRMIGIADSSRYNIPTAGQQAADHLRRCREAAQRRFESAGRLRSSR